MIISGFIQETDISLLRQVIKSDYKELKRPQQASKSTLMVGREQLREVPWRQKNVSYSKNQIFLDIIESVSQLTDSKGTLLKFEIQGSIQCNSQLSGVPKVIMFFEDAKTSSEITSILDPGQTQVQFHQCVSLEDQTSLESLSFIPPDGQFELIKYTIKDRFKPLFQISQEIIKNKPTFEELQISICSAFSPKTVANDIEVLIPVPCDSTDVKPHPSSGSAEYLPGKNLVKWRLFTVKGQEKQLLHLSYKLPSVKSGCLIRESLSIPIRANQHQLQHQLSLHEWPQSKDYESPGSLGIRGHPMGPIHHKITGVSLQKTLINIIKLIMSETDDPTPIGEGWIPWFCNLQDNDFYCEIDLDFFQDPSSLFGLASVHPDDFYEIIERITSRETPDANNEDESFLYWYHRCADIYSLAHARFILTPKGLALMREKHLNGVFGVCPRVLCANQHVLPVAISDNLKQARVKIFCPQCQEVYAPKKKCSEIDGATFGTSFPHLLLQVYPDLIPRTIVTHYVPKIFGFKIDGKRQEKFDLEGQGN